MSYTISATVLSPMQNVNNKGELDFDYKYAIKNKDNPNDIKTGNYEAVCGGIKDGMITGVANFTAYEGFSFTNGKTQKDIPHFIQLEGLPFQVNGANTQLNGIFNIVVKLTQARYLNGNPNEKQYALAVSYSNGTGVFNTQIVVNEDTIIKLSKFATTENFYCRRASQESTKEVVVMRKGSIDDMFINKPQKDVAPASQQRVVPVQQPKAPAPAPQQKVATASQPKAAPQPKEGVYLFDIMQAVRQANGYILFFGGYKADVYTKEDTDETDNVDETKPVFTPESGSAQIAPAKFAFANSTLNLNLGFRVPGKCKIPGAGVVSTYRVRTKKIFELRTKGNGVELVANIDNLGIGVDSGTAAAIEAQYGEGILTEITDAKYIASAKDATMAGNNIKYYKLNVTDCRAVNPESYANYLKGNMPQQVLEMVTNLAYLGGKLAMYKKAKEQLAQQGEQISVHKSLAGYSREALQKIQDAGINVYTGVMAEAENVKIVASDKEIDPASKFGIYLEDKSNQSVGIPHTKEGEEPVAPTDPIKNKLFTAYTNDIKHINTAVQQNDMNGIETAIATVTRQLDKYREMAWLLKMAMIAQAGNGTEVEIGDFNSTRKAAAKKKKYNHSSGLCIYLAGFTKKE